MQVTEQLVQDIIKVYGEAFQSNESVIDEMAEQILYLSCALEELSLQSETQKQSEVLVQKEPSQKALVQAQAPVDKLQVPEASESQVPDASESKVVPKSKIICGNEFFPTIYQAIALGLQMPYDKFVTKIKTTLVEDDHRYLLGKFEEGIYSDRLLVHIGHQFHAKIYVSAIHPGLTSMYGNVSNDDDPYEFRIAQFDRDKFVLLNTNFKRPLQISKTKRNSYYPGRDLFPEKREMFADRLRQQHRKKIIDECRNRTRMNFNLILELK